MKKVKFIIAAILITGASFGAYSYYKVDGTCTGSANCRVCKNCKYCALCSKNGGSCGVCR